MKPDRGKGSKEMEYFLTDTGFHIEAENWLEVLFKLLASLFLASVIGIERQRKGRSAGLRTHVLVALGSTLLMLVSAYMYETFGAAAQPFDQARIAAGIMTGIGFLGAGTIITSGYDKLGLTTAATVWFTAALGIAVGAGYLITACLATAFVLAVVTGFAALSPLLPQYGSFLLSMQLPASEGDISRILQHIEEAGRFEVHTTAIQSLEEGHRLQYTFHIHSRSDKDFFRLTEMLHRHYSQAANVSLERIQL